MTITTLRTLAPALLLTGLAVGQAEALARVVTPREMRGVVDVREVSAAGDSIRGRLVNLTDSTLENVTLIVTESFLWRDEFHPGPDSPGYAETVTVDRVPPRGAVEFSIPRRERPMRPDGRFETSVEVLSLTERPPTGAGSRIETRPVEPQPRGTRAIETAPVEPPPYEE